MSVPGQHPILTPIDSDKVKPLDLGDVQGDITHGFSKNLELFVFFDIVDGHVDSFRRDLHELVPLITTGQQVVNDRRQIAEHKASCKERGIVPEVLRMRHLNISFSHRGISKILNTNVDIGDPAFKKGQFKDAFDLGDGRGEKNDETYDPEWDPEFKKGFDGVFLLSADSEPTLNQRWREVSVIFQMGTPKATAKEAHRVLGKVRPKENRHREHFGFEDGISNPAISGVNFRPNPGQGSVPQGVILMGRPGDADGRTGKVPVRPQLALDGSILAFRYLLQDVPEFNKFLKDHAVSPPLAGKDDKSKELTGARLMGRWRSGAPTTLAPWKDDEKLAKDPARNNDFRYDENANDFFTQVTCPFSAHTRKTTPRNDLEALGIPIAPFRIMRRGIAFGPELTDAEKRDQKTYERRGLLFVSYQSSLDNGFRFIQKDWANEIGFPIRKPLEKIGFDPIIGQNRGGKRFITGLDPSKPNERVELPAEPWVKSRGGEYFFSPSISVLKEISKV